jgi:hypothetical protein
MPKRRTTNRNGLKMVKTTQEEREQMTELLKGHPWQLTLGSFLSRVCSDRGFELCNMEVVDPKGNLVKLPYLKNPNGKVIHLPGNLAMEDMLDENVTGSLCRRIGIPPEDFGLQLEEPYEGD